MRLIYSTLLVALMAMPVPLIAADAPAPSPSNAEISKRLKDLDSRIERLERRQKAERKAEKKAAAKKGEGKAAAAKKAPTKADWQKVYIGMQEDQVRKILGEPARTRSQREHQVWSWHPTDVSGGEIWFKDRQAERVFPPK